MATFGLAGPGRGYVRALRQANLFGNGLPAAQVLRGGLLVLAATHLVLVLAQLPESAAANGHGLLLIVLASALTIVALAATTSSAAAPTSAAPAAPVTDSASEVLDLLARLNHDLRTPLNAVIGFSDLMQRETFGPLGNERYQEYARHIRASGDELLKATEDTLAMTALLAAPQRLGQRTVDLAGALDVLRSELVRDGCRTPLNIQACPAVLVLADPDALHQALRHVICAAAAHACTAAPIEIETTAGAGCITLTVRVGRAGAPTATAVSAEAPGLGREALSLRLARALLSLQGIDLASDTSAVQWQARLVLRGVMN